MVAMLLPLVPGTRGKAQPLSRERKRDEADFALTDSCRSGRSTPRTLRAFFKTYSVRRPECLGTVSMHCRTLYRRYRVLAARTPPSGVSNP